MSAEQANSDSTKPKDILIGVGILCLISLGTYWLFSTSLYELRWNDLWTYRQPLLSGWLVSLQIAVIALVLSTIIGLLVIVGYRSRFAPIRIFFRIYVEFTRGMPLIAQIYFAMYVVSPRLTTLVRSGEGFFAEFLRFTNIDFGNPYIVGVAVLSSFSGAYLGEIFRGGVESIPSSQLEAARAVGFSRFQIGRYIIAPQAMRRVLPGVAGQLANLVKDSSLLHIIAVYEITYQVQGVAANAAMTLEAYAFLAVAYLAVTLPIFWISRRLERRFAYVS